ncbi:MAG: patatin-like phospholipase family protein [Candidatus Peregrinibacteria bacterium]
MTWGLVLSGGNGIANIGVLNILEREGLRPDFIAGSSAGALVGASYALGIPLSALTDIVKTLRLTNAFSWSAHPFREGLLRPRFTELLTPLLHDARIGGCRIPFVCVAGRVQSPIPWTTFLFSPSLSTRFHESVEPYVFPPETRILDAINASSALPILFPPVTIDRHTFVDLCLFGAVPVRTLRTIHHPDTVIATNTTFSFPVVEHVGPPGLRSLLREGRRELRQDLAAANLVITPAMRHACFRFDCGPDFIEDGEKATEMVKGTLLKILRPE